MMEILAKVFSLRKSVSVLAGTLGLLAMCAVKSSIAGPKQAGGALRISAMQAPAAAIGIGPICTVESAGPSKPNILIHTDRSSISQGQSVRVVATLTSNLLHKPIAGRRLWPYVNAQQWGSSEETNRQGIAKFILPLPDAGIARLQVSAQGSRAGAFPVGEPLPASADVSNTLRIHVAIHHYSVPLHPRHMVGIEYEPWFASLLNTWHTAESVPLLGKYSSFNKAVIRQHVFWLDQMGINYILIDWTNNLWHKKHFGQRAARYRQLISATTLLLHTYAQMRQQGYATPQVVLLLGLRNGTATTTTTAINEEIAWIYNKYVHDPRLAGLYLNYHKKPLVVIFNSGGPAFVAHTLALGEPPIASHGFCVRWMASQLQYHSAMVKAGYWSWMDGVIRPVPTYHAGACEALTIAPAFFMHGGWLDPSAKARDNGFNYVREFATALRYRPRFLNICQWNEFAGQRIGHGYGSAYHEYVDSYNVQLNNDIEPTSLTACAYRGCGGWGFYYLNLTRAFINLYRQPTPQTTIVSIGSPDRDAVVHGQKLEVRWASVGKSPQSFKLWLDARPIATHINSADRSYILNLAGLKPGRHELTLQADGSVSRIELSRRHDSPLLIHPAVANDRVAFFIR